MRDELGDRMKSQYESRTKQSLPRRTYTIIRLDGKAFHTFTRGAEKPFDHDLMWCMQDTTKTLCEQIQGVKFGYTQSDEISLLLTDFDKITSDAWFDGNVQKITSISASIATAAFAKAQAKIEARCEPIGPKSGVIAGVPVSSPEDRAVPEWVYRTALFDARVFTIPDPIEVENSFIWRQQDATRNSIQMLAQSLYNHKSLHGRNTSELQELCFKAGHNWNDLTPSEKRGTCIIKESYSTDSWRPEDERYPEEAKKSMRTRWAIDKDTPIFTQDREYLRDRIPRHGG
jgi:tRNA(His) 5'-end guanylyltransferase